MRKNRLIAAISALAMLPLSVPSTVCAVSGGGRYYLNGSDLSYLDFRVDPTSGSACIISIEIADDVTELVIPEQIEGCPVIGAKPERYQFHMYNVEKLVLPDTMLWISDSFRDLPNLKEVVLSDRITELYDGTFRNCRELEKVTLGTGLQAIDNDCFSDCPKLTEIALPDQLRWIGADAFANSGVTAGQTGLYYLDNWVIGCDKDITALDFRPDTVGIAGELFRDCTKLKEAMIPDSIAHVTYPSFEGCTSLERVHLPDSIESMPYEAFIGCTSLEETNVPDSIDWFDCSMMDTPLYQNQVGVHYVDEWVIGCDSGLDEVVVREGAKYLCEGAFAAYDDLSVFDLPESLESIWTHAFAASCYEDQTTSIVDGWLLHLDHSVTEYEIPEGTVGIARSSITRDNRTLQNLVIPESVQHINPYAIDD